MSTTFIVWGKNHDLATRVQTRLERNGQTVIIGGDENLSANFQSHHLHQRVVDQMNLADRALILAQWPPEDNPSAPAGDFALRPNLLFEWGFLFSRFQKQPYLHLFLIGIDRNQLPSDLIGVYAPDVIEWKSPFAGNPDLLAEHIVSRFLAGISSEIVDPLQPFREWPEWCRRLGEAKGSDETLANALVHSIQPAYYLEDVGVLRDFAAQLSKRAPLSSQLRDGCTVASAACDYYTLTATNNKTQSFGQLLAIVQTLKDPIVTPTAFSWIDVIGFDIQGIIRRRMAIATDPELKTPRSLEILADARKALECALAFLELLTPTERHGGYHMWRGYALRNLGRACSELKDLVNGERHLLEARNAWRSALGYLAHSRIPDIARAGLSLEPVLVDIDLHRYGYAPTAQNALNDAVRTLRDGAPRSVMWRKVAQQALDLAERLGETLLAAELRQLLEKF